ncbi:MAG TPA: hypothetical protein VGB12_11560 [bacterium]|jgi:hypothetical protein
MEAWFKGAIPHEEFSQGGLSNPDESAIDLEEVVAGTALEDYPKGSEEKRLLDAMLLAVPR